MRTLHVVAALEAHVGPVKAGVALLDDTIPVLVDRADLIAQLRNPANPVLDGQCHVRRENGTLIFWPG